MNRILLSAAIGLTLILSAYGEKPIETPDLPDAAWLKLSKDVAPFLGASKPDRSAIYSAVSSNGELILDAYQNGNSLVLSSVEGDILGERALDKPVVRVMFSTAGEAVTVDGDGTISIWTNNLEGAPEVLTVDGFEPLNVMPRVTTAIPLMVGKNNFAIGGDNQARGLYNRETGEKISALSFSTSWIDGFTVSPDGSLFATDHVNEVIVYRMADGAFLGQYDYSQALNDTGGDTVRDIAFSSDSRDLHVTHWASQWRVMDVGSNEITDLGSLGRASAFALSPNDLKLAFGNYVLGIYVHEDGRLEDGRYEVVIRERNRTGIGSPTVYPLPDELKLYFLDFDFSPDGERFAGIGNTMDGAQHVIIWDVGNQSVLMNYRLERQSTEFDDMHSVRPLFSDDGNYVSVGFPDHHAYVLPASRIILFQYARKRGISVTE